MPAPPPAQAAPAAAPLDLSGLVLRRARLVAIAFLLVALGLGLVAARHDTREEIDGALALARLAQRSTAWPAGDAQALALVPAAGTLRHVRLQVRDADGRVLADTGTAPAPAALRWLMGAPPRDEGGAADAAARSVSWPVARPGGRPWTIVLTPDPASEEREALVNLIGMFGLMAGCCLLMLAVMTWNVRRAFRPLQALLGAISRLARQDAAAVAALPRMPIRELEATSQALKRLAGALREAENARRVLARKVLTLQEDERQRLARDLHDEFGQRLTALRADASWLARRVAAGSTEAQVLEGMSHQIATVQRTVREMLAQLQPLPGGGREDGLERLDRLAQLLDTLSASWSRADGTGLRCEAIVRCGDAIVLPSMADAPAAALALPRAVVLTLYRISQEAFTNAARHAGAHRARVELDVDVDPDGRSARLSWRAADDGRGVAAPEGALARGNGLAGMQERIWAHGGEFAWAPSSPGPLPGLALHAHLSCAVAQARP